jgi:hypothetical protein
MIGQKILTRGGAEWVVVGETPRLWVAHEPDTYRPRRWTFPKKGGEAREARDENGRKRTVFMTELCRAAFAKAEDDRTWMQTHAYRIGRMVEHYRGDVAVLREIARMVGYEEPAPRA